MHNIKLVALDLDGTLLNTDHQLTTRTIQTIKAVQQSGTPVVLATGRPYVTSHIYHQALGLNTPGVYMQGLNIIDAAGGVLHERHLDDALTALVGDFSVKHGLTAMAYNPQHIFTRQRNHLTLQLQTYYESKHIELGEEFAQVGQKAYISKFIFIEPDREKMDRLRTDLSTLMQGRASVFTSQPEFLELLPLGASKGDGVAWLLRYLDIATDHLLAIGDGENDLEMIKLAGFGIAMANGNSKLKALAKHITLSNDEDGVAVALEKFILAMGE
jgi:Cof subfamily protein (haloacid dehalogenase superfamily)